MSSLDAIGPDLKRVLDETPEQHTAKVLAEVDRLLGNGSLLYVSVELDAEGKRYADSDAYTTQGHETFIGALAALIEACRADDS